MDAINRMLEKKREKNAMLKEMEEQVKVQRIITEKQKSSNERELERFMNTEREEMIKRKLAEFREAERRDVAFGHNPLDVKNITNHTEFDVLKQKNIFSGNHSILNTPSILKGRNLFMK